MREDTGIVLIGRNEGERLERGLASCAGLARSIVYADSGSSDGSVERARAAGAEVVELDLSIPANAARGRNAGLARLVELNPDLRYVFFVDGDCEVVEGFLDAAIAELERDDTAVAVCGRRREIDRGASVFNRIIDTEWDTPIGQTAASGGDVVVRARAVREIGGYDETMHAGEDPEMCFRLRARGGRILRIDRDMTRHDVAILRFSSWWKRHARGGFAFADGAARHLHGPQWYNLKAVVSILAWGLLLPAAALVLALFTRGLGALLLVAYGLLWYRIRAWRLAQGDERGAAGTYARYMVLGKFAEAGGVLRWLAGRLTGRRARNVDYKEY